MYSPVWGGYLLHWLFDIKEASVVATAYLAFWAGPFTPFFPMCIAITLGIKRFFEKLKSRKDKNNISTESDDNTIHSSDMSNDAENNDKKDYE